MFGLITEKKHNEIVGNLKAIKETQGELVEVLSNRLNEASESYDSCVELNEKIYKDARAYLIAAAREAHKMELLFKTYLQELDYKYEGDKDG